MYLVELFEAMMNCDLFGNVGYQVLSSGRLLYACKIILFELTYLDHKREKKGKYSFRCLTSQYRGLGLNPRHSWQIFELFPWWPWSFQGWVSNIAGPWCWFAYGPRLPSRRWSLSFPFTFHILSSDSMEVEALSLWTSRERWRPGAAATAYRAIQHSSTEF